MLFKVTVNNVKETFWLTSTLHKLGDAVKAVFGCQAPFMISFPSVSNLTRPVWRWRLNFELLSAAERRMPSEKWTVPFSVPKTLPVYATVMNGRRSVMFYSSFSLDGELLLQCCTLMSCTCTDYGPCYCDFTCKNLLLLGYFNNLMFSAELERVTPFCMYRIQIIQGQSMALNF